MAIKVGELIKWLEVLEDDAEVGIDDGGLTLQEVDNPDFYIEIGGLPTDDEDDK